MPRPVYRGFRGDRLKELREAHGWTQEHLAVRAQAFPTMVGKWERGVQSPGPESVTRLAEVLGVTPQEFSSVEPGEGSLDELRVWSGRTRRMAAEALGLSEHRLFAIEHLTVRPSAAVAERMGRLYGVAASTVLSTYDRDHSVTFARLAAGGQ